MVATGRQLAAQREACAPAKIRARGNCMKEDLIVSGMAGGSVVVCGLGVSARCGIHPV